LDLARVVEVVGGDAREDRAVARLGARVTTSRSRSRKPAIASRIVRCISTSIRTSSRQTASVSNPSDGRWNQFEPLSGNEPRVSPRKRRRTVYFQ